MFPDLNFWWPRMPTSRGASTALTTPGLPPPRRSQRKQPQNFDSFVTTFPAGESQAVQTEAIYRSPGQTFTVTHSGDRRWARRASAEPWIQPDTWTPTVLGSGWIQITPSTPATRTHTKSDTQGDAGALGHALGQHRPRDSDPQTPRDAPRLRQTDQRTLQ